MGWDDREDTTVYRVKLAGQLVRVMAGCAAGEVLDMRELPGILVALILVDTLGVRTEERGARGKVVNVGEAQALTFGCRRINVSGC